VQATKLELVINNRNALTAASTDHLNGDGLALIG
jgi:hypothetical protein